ncbi:uncharacterized protein [Blastocystis hominis]|uniref:PWI domain-containing protein n=1 Tax=Blastocystis hominis TaxID=12968 RepID=D8M8Q6_BLAHO|nr:uncharacterized protein [Blastocystis hominis]CBK24445.2 unnamed protein product [Blastocystis hominis]|eukprot:XP_012898493.1 uncharacterized protein [Blastocystis hominis]
MKAEIISRWIMDKLVPFGIDDDMVGEYLGTVLEDDSYDLDYKLDFVQSYIQDLSEQNIKPFLDDLREFLSEESDSKAVSETVIEKTHTPTLRERINKEREEAKSHETERKAIDIKQMKQREQLLNTYGFDVVETDQDGNLIYREKKVIPEESEPLEGINQNALRVKMAEKMKREEMKAAHDSEVKRNKELEAKRKADKEKRKTQKQERRGRGETRW